MKSKKRKMPFTVLKIPRNIKRSISREIEGQNEKFLFLTFNLDLVK